MPIGDFLQALLEDDVAVGHLQRVGVADVQLVLPESPFAFRALDRHAGVLQMAAHRGVKPSVRVPWRMW